MPDSVVAHFTDPYAFQTAIRGARLEFLPTENGEFHAELTKVTLHKLWMQRGNESLPRIFHGTVSPQRAVIGFLTDSHQPAYRHCGTDVSPVEIIVNDGNEMHRQTTAPCRWGAMSLTLKDLSAAGATLAGRLVRRPTDTVVIRPARAHMLRLMELHATAGQLAKTAPYILANPQVASALENDLIHAMIMCLTDDNRIERSGSSQRHSVIMARLEEFLSAHKFALLYVADVCAAIGVSERTLRACCQEQIGMGLIRYLWLRRMYLARRALIAATPSTSTVTRIAADYGFWELGRFSVEYRARFGESPLTTLRRPY